MSLLRVAAAVLVAVLASACSIGQDTKVAEAGVATFRGHMAKAAFAEIYDSSAQDWKKSVSREDSDAFLGAVNRKLGALKSTKQAGWRDNATTGGHLVTLQYHTTFESGDGDETFVFRLENGRALLAGYHINSMALIVK